LFLQNASFCHKAVLSLFSLKTLAINSQKPDLAVKAIGFGFQNLLRLFFVHLNFQLIVVFFLHMPVYFYGFLHHLAEDCFFFQIANRTHDLMGIRTFDAETVEVVGIFAAYAFET
jgi:hypothetical protein